MSSVCVCVYQGGKARCHAATGARSQEPSSKRASWQGAALPQGLRPRSGVHTLPSRTQQLLTAPRCRHTTSCRECALPERSCEDESVEETKCDAG